MEAEPDDTYEYGKETKPRHEHAPVGLRSLECEVIRDDRMDLSGRHAGRMKRRNGMHVRP